MKKIEQLKLDNPDFNINIIDFINTIFNNTKYINMIVNIMKESCKTQMGNKDIYAKEISEYFGVPIENLYSLSVIHINLLYHFCFTILRADTYDALKSFIDFNEKKLTVNRDITKYKSIKDINDELSIVNLKLLDKKLESQVIKLYDDGEWVIIKPLTHNASLKYGYGTKWCTVSKNDPQVFFRYARNGSLIYCINRNNSIKVAAYKSHIIHQPEISFWDSEDNRMDSLFLNLSDIILNIIKKDFTYCVESNYDLMSEELKMLETIYFEYDQPTLAGAIMPQPYDDAIIPQPIYNGTTTTPYINNETLIVNINRSNTTYYETHEEVDVDCGYEAPF